MDGQENARLTRPVEPEAEQRSSGPRFARFVAAIEANPPPQAQLLKEPPWSLFQQAPSAKAAPTVGRVRGCYGSASAARRCSLWLWLQACSSGRTEMPLIAASASGRTLSYTWQSSVVLEKVPATAK
jgi:hypothetical protein